MLSTVVLICAGAVVSAFLGAVVACGWVSLCYRTHLAEHDACICVYDSQWDFGQAWVLSFVAGMAMTAVGIAWRMGVI